MLVDEGPARVEELIALGAVFDREATGALQRAREGGHSHARILHAGGAATGAEVERALVAATRGTAAEIREHAVAVELLVEDGACAGVRARCRRRRPPRARGPRSSSRPAARASSSR